MVGDVLHGALAYGLENPGLAALVALGILARLSEKVRGRGPRDPVRRFSRAQKTLILGRAGQQCEHHGLSGRCAQRERLEADHVHPHSRGGWTSVENGQALCRRHNKAKRARVPYNGELRRLARRRAAYFPPGVQTQVMRRRPRGVAPSRSGSVAAPAVATSRERHVTVKPTASAPGSTTPVVAGGQPEAAQLPFRRFDPARAVEVDVDGMWLPALQSAWWHDAERGWIADVSWFQDYSVAGGRHTAAVPAHRIRPSREQVALSGTGETGSEPSPPANRP